MMKFFLSLLFLTNLSFAQIHEQDGYEQIARGKIVHASSGGIRPFAFAPVVQPNIIATFQSPLGVTVKIISTIHARGEDSAPFRAFSKALEHFDPEAVLLEGYSGHITWEAVKKYNRQDEMHYGALLALQKGIEAWGMEPTWSQRVSGMKERGFTGQDLFFEGLLEGLLCLIKSAPVKDEEVFSNQLQISRTIKIWCEEWEKTPEGPRELDQLSDEFKERDYMKIAGRFQEWKKTLTSSTQSKISDCDELLRDKSMVDALMHSVKNGKKKIEMMYGRGHYNKQYSALCDFLQCVPTYERT